MAVSRGVELRGVVVTILSLQFRNVIFSSDKIQETWTLGQERREAARRVEAPP